MLGGRSRLVARLLLLGILAGGVACDNNDDDETGSAGIYTGTLSGSGVSGRLGLTIAASAGLTAGLAGVGVVVNGALSLGGPSIVLVGTFDPDSGILLMAGGGYDFTGLVVQGRITGQWAGPGITEGTFVALLGDASVVTVLCATFDCDAPPACDDTGSINLAASLNVAMLTVANADGDSATGMGSYIGSAVHFVSGTLTIDGTISGSTVTGTWSESGSGASGDWQGSSAACVAD